MSGKVVPNPLGLLAAGSFIGIVVIFGWTRLVLDPIGFLALIALAFGLVLWAACHSALIEISWDRESSPPRHWKFALSFAVIYSVFMVLLLSNRAVTLGYDVFRLPARSMAPTLVAGDYIVVDSWHYLSAEPKYGEIVVFEVPDTPGIKYIKRVVGLPGDYLSFLPDGIIRNGALVSESYAVYGDGLPRQSGSFSEVVVPASEFFVLGDNRDNSRDSRYFGSVPRENIVGKATHIWYSNDENFGVQWDRFPARID